MKARKKGAGGDAVRARMAKWLDECRLAAIGIVLASKKWTFWVIFLVVFVVFGTLISLLSSGSSAIDLFFAADFGGKMQILGDGFLTLMGKGRGFTDWLLNFSLAVLQAVLIALIVMIFKRRKAAAKEQKSAKAARKQSGKNMERRRSEKDIKGRNQEKTETEGLQNAGIAAGLALLGSGCPTCGTTLITPILSSMFSTGSYAIAGAISGILTAVAFLLIFWSLKKMGLEMYVIIKDEKWRKERAAKKAADKSKLAKRAQ